MQQGRPAGEQFACEVQFVAPPHTVERDVTEMDGQVGRQLRDGTCGRVPGVQARRGLRRQVAVGDQRNADISRTLRGPVARLLPDDTREVDGSGLILLHRSRERQRGDHA